MLEMREFSTWMSVVIMVALDSWLMFRSEPAAMTGSWSICVWMLERIAEAVEYLAVRSMISCSMPEICLFSIFSA